MTYEQFPSLNNLNMLSDISLDNTIEPVESSIIIHCHQELWRGFIPIRFTLSSYDIASSNLPNDVFVLASRYSYLSHISEVAIEYFRAFSIDMKPTIWFECKIRALPLKSHMPIGALFDMLGKKSDAGIFLEDCNHDDTDASVDFIWDIVINFSRYPVEKLMKCESNDKCKEYYFHSLKQALHLIHGTSRIFTSLTIEHQNLLWQATCHGNFHVFNNISISNSLKSTKSDIRIIPIRLILHMSKFHNNSNQILLLPSTDKIMVIQKPVSVYQTSSTSNTTNTSSTVSSEENNSKFVENTLQNVLNSICPEKISSHYSDFDIEKRLFIQGIHAPLSSHIYDLWLLLHHADLFMYIILNLDDFHEIS